MYAHHVVEMLDGLPNGPYKQTAKTLALLIRKAHKFHLPDFDAISATRAETERRIGNDPGGFKPPFSLCWFDFPSANGAALEDGQEPSSKRGVLLAELGDDITLSVFSYADKMLRWAPPIARISLNFKENTGGCYSYIGGIPQHVLARFNDESSGDVTHVFNCIYLLNCVNITTENNTPPEKLNSKRLKRGKVPLYEYKTLVLKPMGKKQTAAADKGLWDSRLHICRGHFKTYTAEKPLFGRIVGRFWWQAAVRGNADVGVIEKEYEVDL